LETAYFVERFLKDDKGRPVKNHMIHYIWHEHIAWSRNVGKYAGIIAPRGFSKTESIVIGLTLYYLHEDQNYRIKIVSNSDSNAKARVSSIKRYIESDTDYKRLAPRVRPAFRPIQFDRKRRTLVYSTQKDDWQKHMFNIERTSKSKDASVESSGILAAPVGGRADILFFDDIVDLRNTVEMPALQNLVKESFSGVWMPILSPTGFCIYVATPWTDNDNTQIVLSSPQWSFCIMRVSQDLTCIEVSFTNIDKTHPCYQYTKDGTGTFTIDLWEEMWNTTALLARRDTMTEADFARAYYCRPFSFKDLTFPSFIKCLDDDLAPEDWLDLVRKKTVDNNDKNKPSVAFVTGVDISSSKRPGHVIFTLGILSDEQRMVPVDIRIGKWTSPEFAGVLADVFKQFRPVIIMVENVALQEMVLEWLRYEIKSNRLPTMPLEGFMTGRQKSDPVIGLPGIEVEFKNQMWLIPNKHRKDHDTLCDCVWCRFVGEFKSYPFSPTTDVVMAAWFAREGARKYCGLGNIVMDKKDYEDLKNLPSISSMNTDSLYHFYDSFFDKSSKPFIQPDGSSYYTDSGFFSGFNW